MNNNPKETIPGRLRIASRDGQQVFQQEYRFPDGHCEWIDVEQVVEEKSQAFSIKHSHTVKEQSFTERFANTKTIPAPFEQPTGPAVEKKDAIQRIARDAKNKLGGTAAQSDTKEFQAEAVQRSLELHAKMIKYFHGEPASIIASDREFVISNSAVKEIFLDLIEVMGGEWLQIKDRIK